MDVLAAISTGLMAGEEERVAELTRQAIEEGLAPKRILHAGLIGGMATVGERFKAH